jgi:hypothetical protein
MSNARKLDQFYTHPTVAKNCFNAIKETVKISKKAVFLEPSAGAGAFFKLFPRSRRIGLDLEPNHPEVIEQDFFLFKHDPSRTPLITVGNPPFGKNSSLAVRFFNHAAQFSSVIAFIIPKTFRKESIQKRLDANFSCVLDNDLPPNSFLFEGSPYDVPCCFQIWVKTNKSRVHVNTPRTHSNFSFVARSQADFAIRRVGGLAGKVLKKFEQYSETSNYFIKAHIPENLLIQQLRRIDWTEVKANNAGNPSISKSELVAKYVEALTATIVLREVVGSDLKPLSPSDAQRQAPSSFLSPSRACA